MRDFKDEQWLKEYRLALEFAKTLWGKHCSFCGKKLEGVYSILMKDLLICKDCEKEMEKICLL